MKNILTINETKNIINDWKRQGFTIGFVPTMGFLHQGHISLIEKAREQNDKVVVSIFVNPLQFGPNEDFEKYPRSLEKDLDFCESAGADLVFSPNANEMYPEKELAFVDINLLGDNLCGAKRAGHFRGVCTVVAKLFNIVSPTNAYFGQKDAQQLAIIKKMTLDLNFDINIIACPIIRETDGLAMSSRNSYLSDQQRQAATIIFKSLNLAEQLLISGERNVQIIKDTIIQNINTQALSKIDYVEIVNLKTLDTIQGKISSPILVAVAVYFGGTRLIDNFIFEEK